MVRQHEIYRSRDEIYHQILQAVKEYDSKGGIARTRFIIKQITTD
jgi:hypothetical protein